MSKTVAIGKPLTALLQQFAYRVSNAFIKAIYCILLLLCCTTVNADNSNNQKQQLKQLNVEMAEIKKLLSTFKTQRSSLQNNLRQAEINIGKLNSQIRNTQSALDKQRQELKKLQQRRADLQQQKQTQQDYIEQHILSAYQIGQQNKLKILLNQQDPEKLSRALHYYDYFNRARAEKIEQFVAIIDELNTLEPAIKQQAIILETSQSTLKEEHRQLLTLKTDRELSLAKINNNINNKDQRLKQLERDRSELQRLVDAVEQTIANITIPSDYRPFAQLKGKLPWPLKGKPSNVFGSYRSGSLMRWQGLRIPAKEGSNIQAIHHGRVVFADWLRGSGLLIIIDHGDGFMSLYAHNQSLLRETGEWVATGENIATVGNSGGEQESGLYFEIRQNGKPSNPSRWCKRN